MGSRIPLAKALFSGLTLLLIAACGGGGGGGGGGAPASAPAPDMTTAKVTFGFPSNQVVPLAPMGTVSQIAALTLDVVEDSSGARWAFGQTVDISAGLTTASATVTVPQLVDLTFTGHAFNDTEDEIFTGTGTGNTDGGTLSVSIGMMVNDNGSPIIAPTMALSGTVACPLTNTGCDATTLLEGSSVTILVEITGTPDLLVIVGGTGDDWSGGWVPVNLSTDGYVALELTWTAPTGSGGATAIRSILLESGTLGVDYTAVETGVSFEVAATASATSGFAFGPVITGLTGKNTGTLSVSGNPPGGMDLLLTVTTEAASALTLYAWMEQPAGDGWINTGTNTGTATGGTITVPRYREDYSGNLAVTATDADDLSTTNTYTLSVGQYPAPIGF